MPFVALLLPFFIAFQDDEEHDRRWKGIERESMAKREQQLRQAIDEASARLAKDPNDAEALLQRGIARGKLGRDKEAVADLEKAISIRPDHAESRLALGEACLDREEYDKARDALSKAIELNPKLAAALLLRGIAHERDKKLADRFDKALEDYGSAIQLDPQSIRAYLQRAGVFEKLKRVDDERADLDRATELLKEFLKSTFPEVLDQIDGWRKKDVKKCREALKKAYEKQTAYRELRSANPEEFDLLAKLQGLERRADELSRKIREQPSSEGKEALRRDLRLVLGEIFDLRQVLQARELDALQRRIDGVRGAMKEQVQNKDKIVEDRLRDMEKGEKKHEGEHDDERDEHR